MNGVRWLVVAVTVLVGGCYRPAPQDGAPCSALGDCPSPLRCDNGVCRAEPADGGAGADAPLGDASIDAPMVDAPDAATGMCSTPPSGAWSAPLAIPALAAPGTFDGTPEMRSDFMELYFKSERNGTLDIWRSSSSIAGTFGAPMLVPELSSAFDEGSPALSPDGLTIYISSDRTGSIGFNDIWRSTRTSLTGAWSAPVRVPELSSAADDEGLTILPDDRVAYFHSNRSGSFRLYRTTRGAPTAPWGPPMEVPIIATGDYENPSVSADECRIYVQAYRNGTGGAGDIYLLSRTTPSGLWGSPVKLLPPSSGDFDADPWVSSDERLMLFTTGGATINALDIHISSR